MFGLLKPGRDGDLAHEALHTERRADAGAHHLQRNGAVVLAVAREIDRGHTAVPYRFRHVVPVAQLRLQRADVVVAPTPSSAQPMLTLLLMATWVLKSGPSFLGEEILASEQAVERAKTAIGVAERRRNMGGILRQAVNARFRQDRGVCLRERKSPGEHDT